ncbi:MAG: type III-B CRISPR module RAMP protein Cmr4 [Candidatus Competibacteraceae bacterium]
MKLWRDCVLTGIYTLSPTHCGTGQTTGAVDLPVARDAATGFPILPATSLKGVARDYCERTDNGDGDGDGSLTRDQLNWLFGKTVEDVQKDLEGSTETEDPSQQKPVQLEAGALVFTEGRLIAYPVRSLNYPFLYATCPMILKRLARDLRALDMEFLPEECLDMAVEPQQIKVASGTFAGKTLVLEDLIYEANEVAELTGLQRLGERLSALLPKTEQDTREQLSNNLVLIPDEDFEDLMQRTIPVQARIKLTSLKTTGKTEDGESGNLWYEENLPSDCLFLSFIGERRQRLSASEKVSSDSSSKGAINAVEVLRSVRNRLATVQLGGNETVGQGLCLWNFWSPEGAVQ